MKTSFKLCMTTMFLFLSVETYCQGFVRTVDGKNYWSDVKFDKIDDHDDIAVKDGRRIIRIPKSEILLLEYMEEGLSILQPDKLNKVEPVPFNDDIASFMAEGKRVYIPLASSIIQQRWAAKRLRELMIENAYWQVVGCEEEADFIMEYVFDDTGSDHAYLLFTDRNGTKFLSTSNFSVSDLIPMNAGEKSAEKIFKYVYIDFVMKGKLAKSAKKVKKPNKSNHFSLYYLW